MIEIDQSPIGRTPRSNPATYTGVFDEIRRVFAKTREAKIRGYEMGRFSFNVKGGRCEACQGQGTKCIEMHFLPDVYVNCEVCHGSRYNAETLQIHYRGKSIADVLSMTVEEGMHFFENFPRIHQMLKALNDVGLSYIRVGQPSTQLSGGEAQRVKLATELGKTATNHTLYVLDEPTTGLHFADIHNLLNVLNPAGGYGQYRAGHRTQSGCDQVRGLWLIDMGPEGGEGGGRVIGEGTPEQITRRLPRELYRGIPAAKAASARCNRGVGGTEDCVACGHSKPFQARSTSRKMPGARQLTSTLPSWIANGRLVRQFGFEVGTDYGVFTGGEMRELHRGNWHGGDQR